jgi:hypothetical protein
MGQIHAKEKSLRTATARWQRAVDHTQPHRLGATAIRDRFVLQDAYAISHFAKI